MAAVEHEDFQGRYAAGFVDAAEEVLRDDTLERFGQRGANLVLLGGREHVDHAVHRLRGAGRMQRAENEVTRGGGGQREFDGFQIAHFADEDDVRVFAQRTA